MCAHVCLGVVWGMCPKLPAAVNLRVEVDDDRKGCSHVELHNFTHLEEVCFFFLCYVLFCKCLTFKIECSTLSQMQLCYKNVKIIACNDRE